ncbi:MAG: PIN domain-containing protein [Deltaproteobacteria bacterium]|nr:PIN domain-containing protein [Deltaproteobacteria bacterium]
MIDLCGEKVSREFFERVMEEPQLRLATSILCVAEFMAGAAAAEEKFLKNWIKSGELEVCYIETLEEGTAAGNLRKRNGIPLPDALILASALRIRAHLLTHDEEFLKKAEMFLPVTDPFKG